jgi:hypothetical protein
MIEQIKIKQKLRTIYQAKRKTKSWIKKKLNSKKNRQTQINNQIAKIKKGIINFEAPIDFSFLNNTNEIVNYFNQIKNYVYENQPVNIDISNITNLSPDIIILLISTLKDKRSMQVGLSGNAPKIPHLNKTFLESGLYNFVKSKGKKKVSDINKLWQHSTNNQVKGEIAGEAVDICKRLFFENNMNYDTDNLYNLLVEAMSNTINHADKKISHINWWLYYFIDKNAQTIKFSFIDLGIGIFKSANFDSYRNYFSLLVAGNSLLVKPFLEGKIISSRENDNEISGKGVRQIINCAQNPEFVNFTIITNDQKINVKEKSSESLNSNFEGTFINFEISYKSNDNGN